MGTYASLLEYQVDGDISGRVKMVGAECEPLLVNDDEFEAEQVLAALCNQLESGQ